MQFEEPGSIIKHGKPEPKLSLTAGNKNEIKCNKEPKKNQYNMLPASSVIDQVVVTSVKRSEGCFI